jgi:hypothetical protein
LTKLSFLVKENKPLAKFWGCRGRLTEGGQTSFAGKVLRVPKLRKTINANSQLSAFVGKYGEYLTPQGVPQFA